LRGGAKINFLDLHIPKSQQLAGEDLQRFSRLREQRQAMLRQGGEQPVVGSAPKNF